MTKKLHEKARLMLLSTLAAVVLLSFSGVAYANPSHWVVYNRLPALHPSPQSFTALPGGIGQFEFPTAPSQYTVYLWSGHPDPLTESNTITATFDVVASNDAVFATHDGTTAGAVRLFFQANLPATTTPSCAGPGYNENNYWWSNPVSYTFTGGVNPSVTLTATLSPSNWSNMCGHFGTSSGATFDAALSNVTLVGLSFGSDHFFATGVGVSSGTAQFQLLSYQIT